jgi:hypothetical protein
MCSSSPCARCRSHTASPDLSTVRPPSTRPMLDHPQSSTPGLLVLPRSSSLLAMSHLSPAHHETSKHDSSHETKITVKQPKCPRFEFKPRQVNDSSQSNQGTDHLVSQNHFKSGRALDKFAKIGRSSTSGLKAHLPSTCKLLMWFGTMGTMSPGLDRKGTGGLPRVSPLGLTARAWRPITEAV